jgi:hypothetical protein
VLTIQDRALFSESKYNWTTAKTSTNWYFLDTQSGNITKAPFGSAVSEVVWVVDVNANVPEDVILYINSTNDNIPGGVTLYTADLSSNNTFRPYVHKSKVPKINANICQKASCIAGCSILWPEGCQVILR